MLKIAETKYIFLISLAVLLRFFVAPEYIGRNLRLKSLSAAVAAAAFSAVPRPNRRETKTDLFDFGRGGLNSTL